MYTDRLVKPLREILAYRRKKRVNFLLSLIKTKKKYENFRCRMRSRWKIIF